MTNHRADVVARLAATRWLGAGRVVRLPVLAAQVSGLLTLAVAVGDAAGVAWLQASHTCGGHRSSVERDGCQRQKRKEVNHWSHRLSFTVAGEPQSAYELIAMGPMWYELLAMDAYLEFD